MSSATGRNGGASVLLSLAHFCEVHGPTPMMVTEALPTGCTSCFEDERYSARRPSTSSRSLNPADGLAGITSRTNSMSLDKTTGTRPVLQRPSSTSSSVIETPPKSPMVAALQGTQSASINRRDSSYGKTWDENDKKRAIPCENCALTLPPKTNADPNSPSPHNGANGPILRSRKVYERISTSPPKFDSSSSESDNAITSKPPNTRRRSRTIVRVGTSSSNDSFKSSDSHEHSVDYISTHEPLTPVAFSGLRHSCLRTLSCEVLPPSSTSPTSPYQISFSNTPNIPSGGPIFFGDPSAGYTTAYVFRIPDYQARGRRRVYALMALSTHHERAAMQSFTLLSAAFREIASWIALLAETEYDRAEQANSPRMPASYASSPMLPPGDVHNNTPQISPFLSGRNRGVIVTKPRNIADIVGMPDFFLELHQRFVILLSQLGLQIGV